MFSVTLMLSPEVEAVQRVERHHPLSARTACCRLDRIGAGPQPRDLRRLHPEQLGATTEALREAQVDAEPSWHASGALIPCNIYLKTAIPIAGCAHQAGIFRFGTNPKTSVLDTNCKAHELDNLYVVDPSFFVSIGFVSIGAVNPSLTAIANAIRVGDHLLQRLP
jgi:choline dehydrogenase-like flavoprotein